MHKTHILIYINNYYSRAKRHLALIFPFSSKAPFPLIPLYYLPLQNIDMISTL